MYRYHHNLSPFGQQSCSSWCGSKDYRFNLPFGCLPVCHGNINLDDWRCQSFFQCFLQAALVNLQKVRVRTTAWFNSLCCGSVVFNRCIVWGWKQCCNIFDILCYSDYCNDLLWREWPQSLMQIAQWMQYACTAFEDLILYRSRIENVWKGHLSALAHRTAPRVTRTWIIADKMWRPCKGRVSLNWVISGRLPVRHFEASTVDMAAMCPTKRFLESWLWLGKSWRIHPSSRRQLLGQCH